MVKRAIIIHGWGGVPDDSWKPWLRAELERRGFEVLSPQMPGGMEPSVSGWLDHLEKTVGNPTKDDYFVGHSLGCISICIYLESLPPGVQVGGCVFVSGFAGEMDAPPIREFISRKVDFGKVRSHTRNFTLINSDDDPLVPIRFAQNLQREVNGTLVMEHGLGHISESNGVHELPSLLNALLAMSAEGT